MKFTAQQFPLDIDHRLKGKVYMANPSQMHVLPKGTASPHPFDTYNLMPGESWELPADAEFIQQRELRGAATPQGGTAN